MHHFSTSSKTPIDQCKDMLQEVDHMLNIVKSATNTKKISITKAVLPNEFLNAVSTLESRVYSGVDVSKLYESSRFKIASPNHQLGPGQYFRYNKLNESCRPTRELTIRDFESPKRKSSVRIKQFFASKSPKDHNLRVKEIMEKRKEKFQMDDLRKRDRFKLQIQLKLKDSKKEYLTQIIKAFIPFSVIYGAIFIMNTKIKIKTLIRAKSRFYLGFLFCLVRFVGVAKRKLRVIRKKIATKVSFIQNIKCITSPFLRFVCNKRQFYKTKVMKIVKFILKSNLLVLLHYRFLKYISVIQSNYRKYKIIKTTRILILHQKVINFPAVPFAWTHSNYTQRLEILQKFYNETTYKYAKEKSKYLYDISSVNKKFVRNFNYWQVQSYNEAVGRNFTFSLPDPPKFDLLSNIENLSKYIKGYEYRVKKKYQRRNGLIDKSYY